MPKEAQARIKINKLLEAAGWRFFNSSEGNANIALEPHVKLTQAQVDAMGNDFETTSKGFIDFLLLDENGFPLLVLEAKAEDKNPLIGKEQARKYGQVAKLPLRHFVQRQFALPVGLGPRQSAPHHALSRTRFHQGLCPLSARPGAAGG